MAVSCSLLILVGSKNSSNTRKLYELASDKTIWIENKEELDLIKIRNYDKIGIISGTSTDIDTINEVISTLNGLGD